MRALTMDELGFVSGGYDLSGNPPVVPVVVPGRRNPPPKGAGNWTIVICDGECQQVISDISQDFFDWLKSFNENKPEITDANGDGKPGDTINCPAGTAPAIGAIRRDANGNVIGNTYTCVTIRR